MKITVKEIEAWLEAFREEITAHKEELSDLDQAIGDGDHGINMARGVKEMHNLLETKSFQVPGEILKAVSMVFIGKIGGAAGPLYGSAFMKMAAEAGTKEALSAEEFLGVLRAGKSAIVQRGKAETGEKTMVDVWLPLLKKFEGKQEIDWDDWENSAEELKNNTKEMHAKKGRAAYLGARSVGHIDPGATSSYYLFKALADTLREGS
ncbi:dihydroxyacetone kinase subunit DhaL [Alkalicoccus daliensis]|uniref:phosphoenolpyruvate--glycerone phosphotransferase n=1 Tax=Alkalicoccus daliensis TaxID=745820 RepID=A0A1H0CWC1_9BACI|nr:dihydroxyacetone kinase subunit DhaL [Alkalicoccus daliensis]SDN62192.1 dihydroxyacetone kinase, C-terminal domain [Alkalicoccus daliensis]